MSTVPSAPPPQAPYYSFLICAAAGRHVQNVYLNGRSVGSLVGRTDWMPQLLPPNGRAVTIRDIADPCPFSSVADLKAALHEVIDRMVIAEPAPTPQPS